MSPRRPVDPQQYGRIGAAWNPKSPEVPVDKDGNWLHYPEYWQMKDGGGWERIVPFEAELVIDSMRSGRSAKYVILKNTDTGLTYPMFITDLLKYLESATVVKGVLKGRWTASKRGQNYGIKVHT